MVFLGGPRQVGKTTFAQSLISGYRDGHPAYLNWDSSEDRKKILNHEWPAEEKLIVFDELHKFKKWRGLIKGYFDKLKATHQFLVTGSARLDYYRKGGDSLLGRYHYFRMHPFSYNEVHEAFRDKTVEILLEFGPLSKKNLAQNLEVDFKTVERWLTILENVYYCYRISPYGAPRIKAVKKEQKLYLWDWSELPESGSRWENFVASHLLKYCHFHEDVHGDRMELRFLRDITGREVDFVVLRDRKPLFAVECKTGEKKNSPNLKYFADRTPIPIFYQVHLGSWAGGSSA
jgi:predicted AAA+ superfamily ATPase